MLALTKDTTLERPEPALSLCINLAGKLEGGKRCLLFSPVIQLSIAIPHQARTSGTHPDQRHYFINRGLYPSAVQVCNNGNGEGYVYSFISVRFMSALIPAI